MRSRSHFVIIACYMLGPSLVLATFSAFTLWALPWVNEFKMPLRSVMLVYFATAMLATLLMPLVGRLLLRFAPLQLMIVGAILMGTGLLASSVITSFALLAVIYPISIASGLLLCGTIVGQSLAIRQFPDDVGTIGGMMMIGWALGASLAPLVLMPILTIAGWRVALASIGGTILVVIPVICWTLMRTTSATTGESTADGQDGHPGVMTTRRLLSSWQFWVILFTLLPMDIVQVGVDQNMAPFLADLHVTPAIASYVLSAKAIGLAVGAFIVGRMADRIDPRIVWSIVCVVGIISLLIIAAEPSTTLTCVAVVAVGLAGGGTVPLITVFLVRAFGSIAYPFAAGVFMIFMLPSQLSPYAAGWVRDGLGTYNAVFLFGSAVIAIGSVAVWQFKSRPEPSPAIDDLPALSGVSAAEV